MNREILFRGKALDGGFWVYGYYTNCRSAYDKPGDEFAEIIEVDADRIYCGEYRDLDVYPIDPKTLGQWTGLVDKNGVKIFEGDIMRNAGNVVEFCNGSFCINGDSSLSLWTGAVVIGNMWDNPDLLVTAIDEPRNITFKNTNPTNKE